MRHRFRGEADVHVSGDMFWYPVQGSPTIVTAPDTMIMRGCPRDTDLGAYLPWEHAGLPPFFVGRRCSRHPINRRR